VPIPKTARPGDSYRLDVTGVSAYKAGRGSNNEAILFAPSPPATLTITDIIPAPILESLNPSHVHLDGDTTIITLKGWDFLKTSVARVNGEDIPTSYVDDRELRGAVQTISVPGTRYVTVFTPPPGGGVSGQLPLEVTVGPTFDRLGVVGAADFRPRGIVAGSIASLFGRRLTAAPATAQTTPLPVTLGDVSVFVNGTAAPLIYVSPYQVNFQVPWEAVGTVHKLQVVAAGLYSDVVAIDGAVFAPGIFTIDQLGVGQAAALIDGTAMIAGPAGRSAGIPSRPAKRGEVVSIYCTGLGPVSNRPATGRPSGSQPLSLTSVAASVSVGGILSDVLFSGLAPGFVGLYQVNARIPADAPAGSAVPLVLTIGGIASNTVTIAVE
jgi:uncharacterized protein (TIGR03437 family)